MVSSQLDCGLLNDGVGHVLDDLLLDVVGQRRRT